ncbi:GGDEF domain-containing protein [Bradyrhizobium sp. U87765 SZCCT0131]|uniref:GGDEF domain-containing protein n=1 Tax=unclassified Bradyrhizobium TaxID=2631580 RepID=UPI001BAE16A0|nr:MULTISPECIES: GGDEF domain-containing protein [unclassified Bradyrhizobium]MBR1219981.1 GGDEF domain-containing protein [Bradyrhizobium sp. U87765 SZCCT0131]MBR1263563.1 GGDEF domain-containing protein [Bradyrhizobium sp. U87765 SZCCT0134]MBR1309132.1 GGDEF domain-containing protein [Bradyrhizobium sp. U87765 SZCCT0110]MBR1323895.1 GGDEF domain-containing protein [Bradyrhizobium sp. U87765 SZCCT0109]MBR1349447.1 GGDEF domain-containing protein [Bradyrhizobium sp. U87765 SZCCT0048]
MSLDISTLYLVAALVAAMLGALLLFFWRQERIPALGWWGTAYLLGAVSIGAWVLIGARLGGPVLLAVNIIGFLACGMVWTAARVFHGRRPSVVGLAAGAAIWAATVFFAGEAPFLDTVVSAAIVAAYAALTASELWSERRSTMRSRWPALVIPVLHGAVLMLPIALGGLLSSHDDAFQPNSVWVMIFAIELVLYAVGTVFIIFMMVSDRTVRAHKAAASIDPLTGLLNRRGFSEATARMIEREAKAGRPVTVMIFDIDHFKSINDRFGHPAGDEVLKLFAAVITANLRITDLIGRIGGEEFAAMLPCAIDETVLAAERVRLAFAGCGIEVDDAPIDTTVSIGVAGGPADTELDVLLASADTALYRAKRGGRNRVEVAAEEPLSLDESRRRQVEQASVRKASVVRQTGSVVGVAQ